MTLITDNRTLGRLSVISVMFHSAPQFERTHYTHIRLLFCKLGKVKLNRIKIIGLGGKMSRITTLEKIEMERNTKQGEVRATYCIFEKDGEKYFQIDTYGSEEREFVGQPSQKIQFNGAFAKKLVSILVEEFWE